MCRQQAGRLGRLPASPLYNLQGGNNRSECAWPLATPKGTQRLPLLLLGESSPCTAKTGLIEMLYKSIKPVTGLESLKHSFHLFLPTDPPSGTAQFEQSHAGCRSNARSVYQGG